ncbi:MAG: nitrous oxide-stimulated promoter family protein [Actinobacteria bacterium]|nr:MAG: nitrous oxide-stimulated promoter family protein [Actinomycetota bacterium]
MTDKLSRKALKDMSVLGRFVALYCADKHAERPATRFAYKGVEDKTWHGIELCEDCSRLLTHGTAKRLVCPKEPKPYCKDCDVHCYGPGYREKVREIMRYSGRKMIMRGRLDMVYHYFF